MAEEIVNVQVNDLLIQILAGLIISAIIGIGSFMIILYKCVHKQAYELKSMGKAIAVVLKLLVDDTRKNHPNSKHITQIDKIYKEIVEDSD